VAGERFLHQEECAKGVFDSAGFGLGGEDVEARGRAETCRSRAGVHVGRFGEVFGLVKTHGDHDVGQILDDVLTIARDVGPPGLRVSFIVEIDTG